MCLPLLQSLMLQIAAGWIAQETKDIAAAKEAHMAEHCPAPSLHGDQAALMVTDGSLAPAGHMSTHEASWLLAQS